MLRLLMCSTSRGIPWALANSAKRSTLSRYVWIVFWGTVEGLQIAAIVRALSADAAQLLIG